MVGLEHYLTVAAALFVIRIFGIFLIRKNVIVILMSIELMLLAVNQPCGVLDPSGRSTQIFTMFVLTVAAAEAAIGLLWCSSARDDRRRRRECDEGLIRHGNDHSFSRR